MNKEEDFYSLIEVLLENQRLQYESERKFWKSFWFLVVVLAVMLLTINLWSY